MRGRDPSTSTHGVVDDLEGWLHGSGDTGDPLAQPRMRRQPNPMLTITPKALAVIRRVTAHRALAPSSGLRIARRDEPSASLQVKAVRGPHPGDSVWERGDARLYLGPGAHRRVEARELDVLTAPNGRVQFILRAAV
jgi:iron-sulfur cluster assembly protein